MTIKSNKLPMICAGLLAIGISSSCTPPRKSSMSNMVARMEVKEPIPGVCDNALVIAVLPLPGNGQVAAKAPKTDEEISLELNAKVSFLKDKPDYEDRGMVSLIINCKGEMVKCEIDNKTKNPDLDRQVVSVFAEMKTWTAGTINNKPVDTVVLYSFTIKNGKITVS